MILHWKQLLLYYAGDVDRSRIDAAHSGFVGRAGQTSYAMMLCRATPEGVDRYASGHGLHAERRLLSSDLWTRHIPNAIAQRSALDTDPLLVTLVINRSPCADCADALADAVNRLGFQFAARIENVRFVCASRGYYQGDFVGGPQPGIRRDRVTTGKGLTKMQDAGWELCVLQMEDKLPPRGTELLDFLTHGHSEQARPVRLDP